MCGTAVVASDPLGALRTLLCTAVEWGTRAISPECVNREQTAHNSTNLCHVRYLTSMLKHGLRKQHNLTEDNKCTRNSTPPPKRTEQLNNRRLTELRILRFRLGREREDQCGYNSPPGTTSSQAGHTAVYR